ncbi:hypothetical protein PILCRDRAFT_819136 [Piloderma croceum F 1598]|uniref:Uncharacterized protein n=1 Tax=Piloderma croceum (strain F 1598) TaxID=765440 RepID=A0A0C3FGM9_PILCF|nr:hypothetical protein PILCRDRAFT_819136 [Piloderma croceum F 1598]
MSTVYATARILFHYCPITVFVPEPCRPSSQLNLLVSPPSGLDSVRLKPPLRFSHSETPPSVSRVYIRKRI